MANPITWRNVEAPQMDLRPLANAGEGITRSFDRLAEVMYKKEANYRDAEFGKEAAALYGANDAAGIDAVLQRAMVTNGGNSRLAQNNLRIAELANAQKGVVLDRGIKNESYQNILAQSEYGAANALMLQGRFEGNQEKIAEAQAMFGVGERGGRAQGLWGKDYVDQDARFVDNREDTTKIVEQGRTNRANEGISSRNADSNAAQVGISRQRLNFDINRILKADADKKRNDGAFSSAEEGGRVYARTIAKNGKKSAEDAWADLTKLKGYDSAKPEIKAAMKRGFDQSYAAQTQVPEYLARPGATDYGNYKQNAETLTKGWAADKSQAQVKLARDNPAAYLADYMKDGKYDNETPAGVMTKLREKYGPLAAMGFKEKLFGPEAVPAGLVMASVDAYGYDNSSLGIYSSDLGLAGGGPVMRALNKANDAYNLPGGRDAAVQARDALLSPFDKAMKAVNAQLSQAGGYAGANGGDLPIDTLTTQQLLLEQRKASIAARAKRAARDD